MTSAPATLRAAAPLILVAGLGYFVDIFDLLLFSVVRVASLTEIGAGADLLAASARVNNAQFYGLMLGGLGWGVLGDRRGRRTVLFGSILLYSLATLGSAMVQTVEQYAWLRFIAGIGLAGELGAALTLVVETVRTEDRSIATGIVVALGVAGAVAAAVVGDVLPWRTSYVVGGVLGLLLLALRLGTRESALFEQTGHLASRGSLRVLFGTPERIGRLVKAILVGVPIWYCVTMLATFAPELAQAVGVVEPVKAGQAVLAYYLCTTMGDFSAGLVSHRLRSRKKTVLVYLSIATAAVTVLLAAPIRSVGAYLVLVGIAGFGGGFWATMITMAVEQFGTDLRATVGSVVPTFVRASSTLITSAFVTLREPMGVRGSMALIGVIVLAVTLVALARTRETFGRDLRFTEAGA